MQKYLNEQGFNIVGYGCTTCIGNSGELDESVGAAITENGTVILVFLYFLADLRYLASSSVTYWCYLFGDRLYHLLVVCADIIASAVLSGNRNFEGRVHALTRANYLASPPLVVAYALAGTVRI